ncbi:LPS export ABC transporter periplasmic protein LptC [Lonepinella koalarum]|uniref:Lipopolysaccharide export system protein LptC n=1 Tax=Lonepinella koalarum TaxID=53417 RepID=A0A4R1KQ63_9PAST|nr:LPS export ABC transporter periplasmic protein LptC [Lonepinella koalarum]MDH2925642.1 LPS export ABC transporter periplasmic protein LptC [Lonepinella koalarum]TCK67164.1 lipopolysaccharide export system protein LptC [Lonepinella koalarum]TFJ89178.1 LPS export ABC transporter periplasmic protein LptC [Lonepinella koalarum]TYG34997.1 LPS export ABC transporter periplasmic protein LptC [Lonepinella koalarum]
MNIRWTVILAIITLILLGWFYSLNQTDSELAELIKQEESPEYVGNKMNTVIYSPTGAKQYVALSEKVEYYEYDGHTDFYTPIVYLFDIQHEKIQQTESWKLSANKATLTKDNMLYLDGNVLGESLLPQSKLQRFETESAVVNLTTQDISSDKQVKINGLNFTSIGLKLTGNLQQQVATLKEQVKTHYEISKTNDETDESQNEQ